jgi:hypothetical protein
MSSETKPARTMREISFIDLSSDSQQTVVNRARNAGTKGQDAVRLRSKTINPRSTGKRELWAGWRRIPATPIPAASPIKSSVPTVVFYSTTTRMCKPNLG